MEPGSYPEDLAETFSDIARRLYRAETVEDTLQEIAELACRTVEGCDFAGMSLVRGKVIETPAQTDPSVGDLDVLQSEIGEGPCMDAIAEHATFYAEDLANEDRWPTFAPSAVERGMRSMLSFRLFIEESDSGERTMGALNLYSRQPAAFDETAREVGLIFASHASVALAGAQALAQEKEHVANLDQALTSRDVIGQAKGILMERERLTADQAFDLLRRASQNLNIKLRDVADRVADTGERPPAPRRGGGEPRRPSN
ncbi:MAG: GAF and ANTAR domain-containing protein [Actinomycetota bacterium]|nr:GAF and ANTAR domain-containing protein [Actinomycetota bacterium]